MYKLVVVLAMAYLLTFCSQAKVNSDVKSDQTISLNDSSVVGDMKDTVNNETSPIVDTTANEETVADQFQYLDSWKEVSVNEGEAPLEKPIQTHGHLFTKTTCPNGLATPEGVVWLKGKWRYFEDFQVSDSGAVTSFVPDPDKYFETFQFNGTKFINHLVGEDNGKQVDATMTGYYFCATKDELSTKQVIFVVEKIEPAGAFGNNSGDIWPCDLLSNMLLNRVLLACNFDWDPDNKWDGQYQYAKCKNDKCTKF